MKPDVLIVGGSLAGMMAALAVRESGRTAAVVSLGPVGRSGNAVVAGGVISSATPDPGNTAEVFLQDLRASGRGIADPALMTRLAFESESMLLRLEGLGVALRREGAGFQRVLSPGHSVARTVRTVWKGVAFSARGLTFLEPIAAKLDELGVPQLNGLRVTGLLRDGERVAGVTAYDRKTGENHVLPAGSVILACGGYGGLFRQNNNVSDIYGDGAGIALEAGCTLRDMEFVQVYPLMMYGPMKVTFPGSLLKAGGVLRNSQGERFMHRYDPDGEGARRDAMARAIWMEVQAGRGADGSVYADCTSVPEDTLKSTFGEFYSVLLRRGLDLRKDWARGSPAVHYTLGGIRIDEDGRTGVPGLYAAGEVCGGVHGVNRLEGCALMEAAIFGRRAGLAAATEGQPAPDGQFTPERAEDTSEDARNALAEDMRRLKELLWERVCLIRNGESLNAALRDIRRLRDAWSDRRGRTEQAFARSLLVAETVAASALKRTESRGAHYRSDYPDSDPAWEKPVFCSLRNGDLIVT